MPSSVPAPRPDAPLLHIVRREEINAVASWFAAGTRVLELGGADGYQAQLLAELGCAVESIDVVEHGDTYHPVRKFDGRRVPYGAGSFDIVFSSNVLEHVQHLPELLAEIARVLVVGGVAIHILPSSAWRWWTTAGHYPALLRRLVIRRELKGSMPATSPTRTSLGVLAKRALGLMPHGEYPNALAELYYFSAMGWRRRLHSPAFELVTIKTNELFYTGHTLFPALSISARRRLSRWLGASCQIIVLRRTASR